MPCDTSRSIVGVFASVTAFGALLTTATCGFEEALPAYQRTLTTMGEEASGWLRQLPFDPLKGEAYDALDPGALFSVIGALVSGVFGALSNTALVILTVVFLLL